MRESRDLRRAAVFLDITPRFAALSIAEKADERIFFVSPFVATVFSTVLIDSLTAFLLRSFTAFLRVETRTARFADLVIGIWTTILQNGFFASIYIFIYRAVFCYTVPMIASIRGTVLHKNDNAVVVDVNGVGYLVRTTTKTLAETPESSDVFFYTYLAVREQALDLYGFTTHPELIMFETLQLVSGIGPKSALSILDAVDVETLATAITNNDASYLNGITGLGKKTAEKIVHELKDTALPIAGKTIKETGPENDALLALVSLGYNERDARDALKEIPKDKNTSTRVTEALKLLAK